MSAELRPRIKIISKLPMKEIIVRIKQNADDPATEFTGWQKKAMRLSPFPKMKSVF